MFEIKSRHLFSVLSLFIVVIIALTSIVPAGAFSSNPAITATNDPGLQQNSGITSPATPYVEGVVLVGLKPGIDLNNSNSSSGNPYLRSNSSTLTSKLTTLKVLSVENVFPANRNATAPSLNNSLKANSQADLAQVYRLKLDPTSDVLAAIQSLSADSSVLFAEPDYIAYPADVSNLNYVPTSSHLLPPYTVNQLTINDPLYSQQWGLAKINIEAAWSATYGTPTVVIAVIDSGIDLTHVDLAAHLWINPGEIAGNGIDDDSNGLIDDVNGWNFVAGSNDVSDDNGHGTLVAGVAAAIAGNGQGIAGVCPQCTIMPVKVMQASGSANYSDIAAGILYAAQKGAKVINLSLGGYANSNTLRNAIDTAVNTYGVVVVAGAGNDNLNQPFYPAAYDNVLAVAGTAEDDTKLNFSNYAAWVDVSAPAVNIRTTALGGDWANGSGTSVASPFAAGLAGLLRTLHPDWNQATIRSQITHTTDSIESLNPTYAGLLGSGRLNAGTAVLPPHPLISMSGYAVNGQASGRPVLGATASLTATLQNDWWDALGVTGTLSTTDSYVTMINASATYGDIPAATSKTNATAFSFSVDSGAGYNHPIPFTLAVTDTTGYSNSFNFTINTETGIINKCGTLTTDTWTNDKTYLVTCNISIPTGNTLTIQPSTTIKFNGNYTLSVRGTLIADGTSGQPIQFKSNTAGTWDKIFFDDLSIDAQADADGNYISGSILRYVNIEGNTGGITCTSATPYLSHVNLSASGISCSLGATPVWFLDNTIVGNVSFTGPGNAYRNTISGGLTISGASDAEDNILNGGALSLGSGTAKRNTITDGGLTVGGTAGSIENNTISNGNVSAGDSYNVLNNTITGSLTTGNSTTVDHNTVSNGIAVGSSALVTWNNVENASVTGLAAGTGVTAQYNRLIGNVTGMTATTGLIEHNLIANNSGVGLQVGAATVQYNTLTGNQGNTILVQGGTPVTIAYNNLEGNTGTYDLYLNIASGVFVMAQHNWWGTTDNLAIAERIYDWNDDDTKATASYTLKLSGPDQTAPAYVRNVTVLPDTTLGIQTGTFQVQFSKPMDTAFTPDLSFYSVEQKTWQVYTTTNSSLPNWIGDLAEDPEGDMWAATRNGLYELPQGGSWTYRVSSGWTESICIDSFGNVWYGTVNGLYKRDSNGYITHIPTPYSFIYAVAIDNQGNVLISTSACLTGCNESNGGILYALDNTTGQWTPISVPDWLTGIFSIYYDSAGDAWVGYRGGVAYRSSDANWKFVFGSSGVGPVWALTLDTENNLWIGGQGVRVRSSKFGYWTPIYPPGLNSCYNPTVNGISVDHNGSIWIGTGMPSQASSCSNVIWELKNMPVYPIIDKPAWTDQNPYQASFDFTTLIPRGNYLLDIQDAQGLDGLVIAPNINTTFTVDYAGFISDTTPPTKPVVTASGDGSLTTLSASWSSSDPESPITQYRYAIGTIAGARDVVGWTYVSSTTTSMTRSGLNLTYGQPYYVTVGARNEGGLWSDDGVSNGVVAGVVTTHTLSISKNGTGNGTVTSNPAGIDCGTTCSYNFTNDTVVTLAASPTSPSTFGGWSGGGCSGIGTCIVSMSSAQFVTATFNPPGNQTLTVSKNGTGSGTVTSSPSGINCGLTCSYAFVYNTVITLTASPTFPSTFEGWSGGGCSGMGTCILTMSSAKSVTANFNLEIYHVYLPLVIR